MSEARSGGSAPTVLRMVLGKRLRHLREQAGMTFEEAGRTIDVTPLTVRRMEKGEVGLKLPYVRELLRSYGVSAAETAEFEAMAREANRPGWWYSYRDVLPEWFRAYVSLENEASLIRAYEPHYVFGLLQTPAYAREVLRAGFPHTTEAELDRRVELRVRRQELLTRPAAPAVWVVLDETALRRVVGGPKVMRGQLDRLLEALTLPTVRLQIMPFAAGPHPGAYGPLHYFRFGFTELPDIVYTEGFTGVSYVDQRKGVMDHLELLDRLAVQAAPISATRDILTRVREEL